MAITMHEIRPVVHLPLVLGMLRKLAWYQGVATGQNALLRTISP